MQGRFFPSPRVGASLRLARLRDDRPRLAEEKESRLAVREGPDLPENRSDLVERQPLAGERAPGTASRAAVIVALIRLRPSLRFRDRADRVVKILKQTPESANRPCQKRRLVAYLAQESLELALALR